MTRVVWFAVLFLVFAINACVDLAVGNYLGAALWAFGGLGWLGLAVALYLRRGGAR